MSQLEVDKIIPQSGTTLTLGDSGDTINFGSGVLPNFENLTVTGDLTVDTNSLKVDSTNNRVGIGTASPSVSLDVVGAITATGNITGTLATAAQPNITSVGTLTGLTVSGNIAGTLTTAAQPNITSVGTLTGLTTTGNISFGDNDRARFGDSGDLQIYHSGNESYIRDTGTGVLYIDTNGNQIDLISDGSVSNGKMARFVKDGAVELYHDNSKKFETTSTGATVTGNLTASGNLTSLGIDDNATSTAITIDGGQNVGINGSPNSYSGYGNLTLGGTSGGIFDLDVNGTRTGSFLALSSEVRVSTITNVPLHFQINNAEKMRLNSTGLGIGTSNPLKKLVASNSGAEGIELSPGDSSNINMVLNYNRSTSAYIASQQRASYYRFDIDTTEAMRLTSTGLGIGTSSPAKRFHVYGPGSEIARFEATGGSSFIGLKDADDGTIAYIGADAGKLKFQTSGGGYSDKLLIDTAGNIGIGTSSPTQKLEVTGNLKINSTGSVMEGISITPASQGSTSLLLNTFNGGVANDRNWAIRNRYNANGRLEIMRSTNNTGDSLTSVMTFERDGDVVVKQDLYVDASGAGIFLGGASTANKLDDYEEGTWTPGMSISSSGNSGTYTKIGNLVFARFKVIPTGSGTNVVITGLPFTSTGATTGEQQGGSRETETSGKFYFIRVSNNSTEAMIIRYDANTTVNGTMTFEGQAIYLTS